MAPSSGGLASLPGFSVLQVQCLVSCAEQVTSYWPDEELRLELWTRHYEKGEVKARWLLNTHITPSRRQNMIYGG
eukprot:6178882-Pleurochrysis_carterae.AAC.3